MSLPDLAQTCEALAGDALGELPADVESLAHMLRDARRAQNAMADVARLIEAKLADAMGQKQAVVAGLGTLERARGSDKETWDHDRIAKLVAARSRDERVLNEDTGEIEGESEAAIRVFSKVASISRYRVGELKARGINVDEVRDVEYGRYRVRFL